MIRKTTRGKTIPADDSSSARLAALESFIFETEGLTRADLDMLNAKHGLGDGGALDTAFRLDRLGDRPSRAASQRDAEPLPYVTHRPARDDGAEIARATRAKVYGDSMADAGMRDGDWVEIDTDAEPMDGDVVLAEIDGGARVLRTLKIIGGASVLLAANPNVEPIVICDAARLTFHGVARRPPNSL